MLIQVRLVPLMVIWYTCHVFAWQPGLLQSKRTQCFHRDQRVTGWCFGSFWKFRDQLISISLWSRLQKSDLQSSSRSQSLRLAWHMIILHVVRSVCWTSTSSYLVVSGAQSCFRTWWGWCTHICCSSTCSTSWKGGCTSVDINISRRHRYVYIIWYTDV